MSLTAVADSAVTPQFTCDKCHGIQFSSRNKLFKHLRVAHHSDPTTYVAKAATGSADCDSTALLNSSSTPQPLFTLPPHFVYGELTSLSAGLKYIF